MMLYPAMNKLTANVPNRYLLVNVVAPPGPPDRPGGGGQRRKDGCKAGNAGNP